MTKRPPPRPRSRWAGRLSRDLVLGVIGAAILAHETLLQEQERTTLLLIAAGFLGAPVWVRLDERRQEREQEDGTP